MNPKVDFYFDKATKWQEEIRLLRTLLLDCHLTEELKWGTPCYTFEQRNIVLIHTFKDYCALLFFKGALMRDPKGILIQQSENTQATKQVRFTNAKQIEKLKATLKAYVFQAVEIEESGAKVAFKKTTEFSMPEEFQQKLDALPKLKAAFEALTPGRQRGYLLYFAAPKQSKTRVSRIEKYTPSILDGKGLND